MSTEVREDTNIQGDWEHKVVCTDNYRKLSMNRRFAYSGISKVDISFSSRSFHDVVALFSTLTSIKHKLGMSDNDLRIKSRIMLCGSISHAEGLI